MSSLLKESPNARLRPLRTHHKNFCGHRRRVKPVNPAAARTPQRRTVLDDDPLRKNVEIVNISPDTNQTWPPPYKVDNMEAYEAFLKDLDRGKSYCLTPTSSSTELTRSAFSSTTCPETCVSPSVPTICCCTGCSKKQKAPNSQNTHVMRPRTLRREQRSQDNLRVGHRQSHPSRLVRRPMEQ